MCNLYRLDRDILSFGSSAHNIMCFVMVGFTVSPLGGAEHGLKMLTFDNYKTFIFFI
jgi:hypothetical protein